MQAELLAVQKNRTPIDDYPFESAFIEIDGHNIHYIDEGAGDVLLFSHAAIGWSYMYRNLIKRLRAHFRCIAMDYPDFGLSHAKPKYKATISNQAKVLGAFIKKLNLRNLTIMGHDTGGPTAFYAALQCPERICGFILTDTIVYPVSQYQKIARMLNLLQSQAIYWLNRRTNFLMRLTTRFGFYTKKLSEAERQVYLDMSNSVVRRDQILNILVSLQQENKVLEAVADAFSKQWKGMAVLMMYGEQDPVYKMGVPQRLCRNLSNGKIKRIAGEGHFPHEGQALLMAKEIISFMQLCR